MGGIVLEKRGIKVSSWRDGVLRQRTKRVDAGVCGWSFAGLGKGAEWDCEKSLPEGVADLLLGLMDE